MVRVKQYLTQEQHNVQIRGFSRDSLARLATSRKLSEDSIRSASRTVWLSCARILHRMTFARPLKASYNDADWSIPFGIATRTMERTEKFKPNAILRTVERKLNKVFEDVGTYFFCSQILRMAMVSITSNMVPASSHIRLIATRPTCVCGL